MTYRVLATVITGWNGPSDLRVESLRAGLHTSPGDAERAARAMVGRPWRLPESRLFPTTYGLVVAASVVLEA